MHFQCCGTSHIYPIPQLDTDGGKQRADYQLFCRAAAPLPRKPKGTVFYIGVDIPQGMREIPEAVFHLPAGEYLCCSQAQPAIEEAAAIFPEQFALDYEKFVVESELSLGDYDCAAPPFELRCSLPD